MESEIDLRPYLQAVLKYWWVVLLSGVVFGLIAFAAASFQRSLYEATTLVAFLEPNQDVQFDPRISSTDTKITLLSSLPDLSESDQMLGDLLGQLGFAETMTIAELDAQLEAESGRDLNLLYLRARDEDPEVAAQLVNTWADLFVNMANEIYTDRGTSQLAFYTEQLEDAAARLQAAEQALIDFQATNRFLSVSNELTTLTGLQASLFGYDAALAKLENDIQAMRTQQSQLAGSVPGVAGEYALLSLQSKILNLQELLPLTVQLSDGLNADTSPQDQVEFLNSLEAAVAEMRPAVGIELTELEPRILALQREQERLTNLTTRLTTDRDLALETYVTLVRKLDEERLTTEDRSVGFKQVSRAATPVEPVNVNRGLVLLLGATFGVVLAAALLILVAWWRRQS